MKETFEFLRDLMTGSNRYMKVRVWDRTSLPRRLFSDDFSAARGSFTESGLYFGWEDGLQSLLQRLHEVAIELPPGSDAVRAVARATASLADVRLRSGGLGVRIEGDRDDIVTVTAGLEQLLRCHVPPAPSTAES